MINQSEAIKKAQQHIDGWDFVNPEVVDEPVFSSKSSYLKLGVKNGPTVRDKWLVSFTRIPTGHPLDNVFPLVTIIVDAETGKTSLLEGV